MKSKIDIRSMVIGAVVGAVVMFSVGAVPKQTSSWGRYQLVSTDGYMLKIDTTTGQIWSTFLTKPDAGFMDANAGK